jgi:hypothetical protein
MATKLSNAAATAAADAIVDLLDGGTIEIRDGSAPTNVDDTATGTVLATLTFGTPAFGAAVNGVATANAITADSAADATGTAGYCRLKTSGGSALIQGVVTVSGGGGDLQLSTTSIVALVAVTISSLTYTHPKS